MLPFLSTLPVLILGCVIQGFFIAIGNAVTNFNTLNFIFATGGFLFMASDVVMIFNTFGKTSRFSLRITNLSLYYIGQILIALSLFFVN